MSARYIVDAEGRPVEAILNIEEFGEVLEAQKLLRPSLGTYSLYCREGVFLETQLPGIPLLGSRFIILSPRRW